MFPDRGKTRDLPGITEQGQRDCDTWRGPKLASPGLTKEMQEHCVEEAERQFSGGGNKHPGIPAKQLRTFLCRFRSSAVDQPSCWFMVVKFQSLE